jgi:TRIAP1/MDM35 family protein
MAHSLSSECTPLKQAYDSCFNAWFAGYLEPTLTPHQQHEKDKNPEGYQKQKAEEYQQKCGKVWESYRECVQVSYFHLVTRVRLLTRPAYTRASRGQSKIRA